MKKKYIEVQKGDPDKCSGHVWRHLCKTRRDGRPASKDCSGLGMGCKNIICVNCGGLDRTRKEYKCFKCRRYFMLFRELTTDKPTCNNCFKDLLGITSVKEYKEFINS